MSPKFKLISSLGELIIPILLFYWWKWDLHYILLFVYIDISAALVMAYLKERKVISTQKKYSANPNGLVILKYIGVVLLSVILFEWMIARLYPEMQLWQSFLNFLLEEELGMPQIALLLPLLFLVNFQQYNMLFIRTQQYRMVPLELLQNTHLYTWFLFLASSVLCLVLSFIIQAPVDIFLFLILASKLISDLLILPKIERNALHKLLNSQHVQSR
jgi:hypothetical protein